MTLPVLLEKTNGHFRASLAGSERLFAEGDSADAAIEALRSKIDVKRAAGELVDVNFPLAGVSGLAGTFADDPSLPEIVAEIYRQRDAERPA